MDSLQKIFCLIVCFLIQGKAFLYCEISQNLPQNSNIKTVLKKSTWAYSKNLHKTKCIFEWYLFLKLLEVYMEELLISYKLTDSL